MMKQEVLETLRKNYDGVGKLYKEYYRLWLEGKCGIVHESGKVVAEPMFDSIQGGKNGIFITKLGMLYGLTILPNIIVKPKFNWIGDFVNNGLAKTELSGKYGVINIKGIEIIKPECDKVKFDEDIIWYLIDGKWGIANVDGVKIKDLKYEHFRKFKNGFAAVCCDGKWTFINKAGDELTVFELDWVNDFEGDFARVEINGMIGYLHKNGKYSLKPEYDEVERSKTGFVAKKIIYEYYDAQGNLLTKL